MTIDVAIKTFAQFVNNSWDSAILLLENRQYTSNENSLGDWLQANWELLVERKVLDINSYLEVYGAGADFYSESSRITDSKALPNYSVIVKSNNSILDMLNEIKLHVSNFEFLELVSFQDGFYHSRPPFSAVLVDDSGVERVFRLDEVFFELKTQKKINERLR